MFRDKKTLIKNKIVESIIYKHALRLKIKFEFIFARIVIQVHSLCIKVHVCSWSSGFTKGGSTASLQNLHLYES